jgi:GTP-binding protein
MAEVILMPRLSDTMTEGVIAAWHKKVGDPVKKGELLAEIETDKATMELESYKDGTLLHLGADTGGKIQVNDLLAIIGKKGEDISKHISGNKNAGKGQPDMQKPVTKETDTADKAEGDVPGYGFAKRSQAQRKSWQKMIEEYIRKRENLVTLFALIDSRHEPQEIDLKFINQLGEWQIPFSIVFTKTDKSTQREASANVKRFMEVMKKRWEELPSHFVTSAVKRTGIKQILSYIKTLNDKE